MKLIFYPRLSLFLVYSYAHVSTDRRVMLLAELLDSGIPVKAFPIVSVKLDEFTA
jgi:hypothetical protein